MSFKQKIFLFMYLIGTVVFGVITADKDTLQLFNGNKIYLWYVALIIFYGVLMFLTIWIFSFLGSICFKIAEGEEFNKSIAKYKTLNLLILFLLVHVGVLYFNYFIYESNQWLFLFLIPIIYLLLVVFKEMKLRGPKAIVISVPFIIYLVIDVLSLLTII